MLNKVEDPLNKSSAPLPTTVSEIKPSTDGISIVPTLLLTHSVFGFIIFYN